MMDSLPPPQENYDPETNIKTVVQYIRNEYGDIIKETKQFRKEKRLVASQIAERKKWKKFGASKNDPPGGNSANTYPADMVTMQVVQVKQPEHEPEKQDECSTKSKSSAPLFICRHCKGSHLTHQCPNKSDLEAIQALQDQIRAKSETTNNVAKELPIERPGHYIPPPLRADGGGASTVGSGTTMEKRPFDGNTIRVTNLPPDTTADDLKRIFSSFGRVMRIYPAKDKLTQQNRGFAFISYETAEQAEAAICVVNGFRHNHVVLKVDWAKPSNN